MLSHSSVLQIGDIVEVIQQNESGWWKGRLVNNEEEERVGLFPYNFVEPERYVP